MQAAFALPQVGGELSFQLAQIANLLPYSAQLCREHVPYMGTGFYLFALQRQEFADFIERKAQFLSAADELNML
jgi:hypothetical protein